MEYGGGKYTYALVEPWAKLPERESIKETSGWKKPLYRR